MSDSVSNVDIEDVLSSIRKLVSQDGRGVTNTAPAEEAGGGRLVLTPAHRVADESERQGGGPDHSGREAEPELESVSQPVAGVASGPAEMDETSTLPPSAHPRDAEEMSEPETQPVAETDGAEWNAPSSEPAQEPEDAASPSSLEDVPAAPVSSGLMAAITELEAAVSETGGEWEPDGSEPVPEIDWEAVAPPTPPSRAPEEPDQPADTAALPNATEGEELGAGDAETYDETALEHEEDPADAAVDPVESEAEFVKPADFVAPEPVIGEAPEAATEPEESADEAEDPGVDGGAAVSDATFEDGAKLNDNFGAYLGSGLDIDEDALRDLVAEIVRQELQGTLGERITRNVRKLVRREIYRILASEDFD